MTKAEVFTVLCVGLKGIEFVKGLQQKGELPARIVSYIDSGEQSDAFDQLKDFCAANSVLFESKKRPAFQAGEFVFVVGWQFLISDERPQLVVFHDSLLPRYRGFAPTVSALINGDAEIGVSALKPVSEVDAGPIFAQKRIPIAYPIKIADALASQAAAMVELACDLLRQARRGALASTPQDHSVATFSIWRDSRDYRIDWHDTSSRILRHIDALGWPFDGAKAMFDGALLTISSATLMEELQFEIRQPGKIWRIEGEKPIVVCGEGLLRLDYVANEEGEQVRFSKLRARFD